MKPETHNLWDIITKAATLLTVIGGGLWALFEHFDTEKQKVNGTFWNTRMDLYVRTSEAAAAIAGANAPTEVTKELREFWLLFHGPMSVFEDAAVKAEMEKFSGLVRAFQGPGASNIGASIKPVPSEFDNLPAAELHKMKQDAAQTLASAMRTSLATSWSKPFEH